MYVKCRLTGSYSEPATTTLVGITIRKCFRAKKDDGAKASSDPKRPWRTNSNKEKLVRIDCELKQHLDKASHYISPMEDIEMQELVDKCQAETLVAPPVSGDRLRETVEAAKKNLTNFQYRKVENTTATAILSDAHELEPKPVAKETEPLF